MIRSTPLPFRVWMALLMLAGAVLACTLSFGSNKSDSSPGTTPTGSGGGVASAVAPVVRIVDPASGARVPRQRVDITVATDTTADRFQVNVNGRVAVSMGLPPGQSGPTQAILSWTPDRDGTYNLEVLAFNGAAASAPVTLTLEVSGTAASGGTPGAVAGCIGRALVSQLNYRDAPGTGANLLGHFDVGETVTVVGRNADSTWYKVQRANTLQVWTINNTQWIQTEGECSSLPVVG